MTTCKFSLILLLTNLICLAQTPDSLWRRSMLYFDQQNYHGVVEDMNILLKRMPHNQDALYNRGVALLKLGDEERGCTDLQAGVQDQQKEQHKAVDYFCNTDHTRDILIRQNYPHQEIIASNGYRPQYTHADTLRGALRPERTCYNVTYYDLQVKIIPGRKKIVGCNAIHFKVVHPEKRIQIDLFNQYQITSITHEGSPLFWQRDGHAVFISFPDSLVAGDCHKISISYSGKPPVALNPPWEGGFVWKRDKKQRWWIGVACEHLGASSWWPTKDHLTDKPDSMLITLDIPRGYQAVSNGNLRSFSHVNTKTDRFAWFVQYPINNYNVTFYMGKYVAFNDTLISGSDTLRMDYNVLDYNLDIAKAHFKQSREILEFYNNAFGFYPFVHDGFGLVESSYAGMEHQSAIAYGNGYNLNFRQEYGDLPYDYIIVHETAHEWWGNSVTAADMADIWIHEGFATYAEYLFLESINGYDEYLQNLIEKSSYIYNVWPLVQNRDVNENSFAGNDVYHKGAMVLHCLRCCVNNDSLFFVMIRDFCVQNRYKIVTTSDFVQFVNSYTHLDFSAFFSKYLTDTRLPVLNYRYYKEHDDLVIQYRWTGVNEGFSMPFGIFCNRGDSYRLVGGCDWQETRIQGSEWFGFYNLSKDFKTCPKHALTYFTTRCESF